MAEHTYKFDITMTCGGCSGAVNRVLKRMQDNDEGVKSYEVSLDTQSATVVADEKLAFKTVHEKIAKTGKKINKASIDGEDTPLPVLPSA